MKRLKNFLLFIPLLITVSACDNSSNSSTSGSNNDTNNKVNFITGDLTTNSLIELKSQEQLDTLRENEYDFIVYAYVQGCSTCRSFETKLEKYIDDRLEYTSDCIALALVAVDEAKLSFLEALEAQTEYDGL